MRLRTLIIISAAIILFGILVYLYSLNSELMSSMIHLYGDFKLPVIAIITAAYIIGFLTLIPWLIVRDSRLFFTRYREKRTVKSRQSKDKILRQAEEAIQNGRKIEALESLNSLLKRKPDHLGALIKGGNILREFKRFRESVDYHTRALSLEGDNIEALYALADDYLAWGETEKGKKILESIADKYPARCYAAYKALRDIAFDHEEWETALGMQLQMQKVPGRPAEPADRSGNIEIGLRFKIAKKKREEGDTKEALSIFKKIIKENKDFLPAYLELGRMHLSSEKEAEAVKIWKEGFKETGSPLFLIEIENHFINVDQPRQAITTYREILQDNENLILPRFYLGKLYNRLEMNSEAMEIFDEIAHEVSVSHTLDYYIAGIKEKNGEVEEACAILKKVIKDTGILNIKFHCNHCQSRHDEWSDFCSRCKRFNTIRILFEEKEAEAETDSTPRPTWI